ncbi:hypothetical protein ACI5KX_07465 [Erythrobacter sp. GH1-10]|uniref:hypothetical protein n=1 Tax=Erythrobacter sp. GH1-10 TaxID=3349334 RepID=UPI003877CD2F
MRQSHIYLAAVAVATIGLVVAAPGASQNDMPVPSGEAPIDQMAPAIPPPDLAPDQQAEYDNWPPDRKYAYDSWPAETKGYYWSLSPERQDLFWRLSDEDKIALTAMTGTERESAWEMIEQRAGQSPDAVDNMSEPPEGG